MGNHGKNFVWKIQKERQYFALLLDQVQKFTVANYECSSCLSLGWILVTVSGHLIWLSAWHLSILYYDTDSLNFIKAFHPNQIICFPVQCVNTLPLKFVNSKFAYLSLFLHSFYTVQTNTLCLLVQVYPQILPVFLKQNHVSCLVLNWLRGGWLLALAQQLHSYKDGSKGVF